jgi:hypothetical protein
MKHITRIRIAALAAAFFLGGATAAGFGLRAGGNSPAPAAVTHPRTQVVHETRVRTVRVHRRKPSAPPAPRVAAPAPVAVAAAATQPAVAPAPTKVVSRVSPTGNGGGEAEHEQERGDD